MSKRCRQPTVKGLTGNGGASKSLVLRPSPKAISDMKEKDSLLQNAGINTRLTHIGNDPFDYHGFINPPVVHASTGLFPNARAMETRTQKYTYGTRGTPTTDALCEAIDALEGPAGTILVPSGLAAVTIPFLGFVAAGDHALVVD